MDKDKDKSQDAPPAKPTVNHELAALAAKVQAVDAAAGPAVTVPVTGPGVAPPLPAPANLVADITVIVGIARPLVEMLVPYLKGAPAEAWQALIQPAADLCAHYGINPSGLMQNPWARLGGAALPLALYGYGKWEQSAQERAADAGKGKALPDPKKEQGATAPQANAASPQGVQMGVVIPFTDGKGEE